MSFYTDVICKHPLFHSIECVRTLDLLEPVTRRAVQSILDDAKSAGRPLMVTETYRSQSRQAELFQQGKTKLKTVGCHMFGLAADLAFLDGMGQPTWDVSYDFLCKLATYHGLISGLDWGQPGVKHDFTDPDHVQRITVADEGRLFAQSWYPTDQYAALTTPPVMVAKAETADDLNAAEQKKIGEA